MTSKQIEDLAVNRVSTYFSFAKRLSPFIASNDKEPCWDNALYIYNDERKNNESLYGRVPVQVKGKIFKAIPQKDEIKYSVSLIDLKIYHRDGGLVYFVVALHEQEYKIYYCKLTPLKLKHYIKTHSEQKTCSIKLRALADYSASIDYEFYDFYNDCKCQSGNTDKVINIADLAKSTTPYNLRFFASEVKDDVSSLPYFLSQHPVYLYAETTDEFNNKFLCPVGEEVAKLNYIGTREAKVEVDGCVYYNSIKQEFNSDGGIVIYIGDVLKITMYPYSSEKNTVSFEFKEKEISAWINDAKFVLALTKHQSLCVDGNNIPLVPKKEDKFIKWCTKKLAYVEQIDTLLRKLHVNKELILKEFSIDEEETIHSLIQAVNEQQEISLKHELSPVFTVEISNLFLALSAVKTPSGKYRISTYKNITDSIYYKDNDTSEPLRTSIYTWFQMDGFMKIDNIDYDDVVLAYKRVYKYNNQLPNRVNNDMLMMLLAYDKTKDNRLLQCAKELCLWLKELNLPSLKDLVFINWLQIIKRERALTVEEQDAILNKMPSLDSMGKAACYLLLDSQQMAEFYINKFTEQERTFFKSLPIYTFYNDAKH